VVSGATIKAKAAAVPVESSSSGAMKPDEVADKLPPFVAFHGMGIMRENKSKSKRDKGQRARQERPEVDTLQARS